MAEDRAERDLAGRGAEPRAATRDRAPRLTGREEELRRIAAALEEASGVAGVIVHGPGGIGKTAVLRNAAERAARQGYAISRLDARDIAPAPDELEDALAPARLEQRPLVVIDSFEHVEALGGYLRRALVPALPPGAAVLIGSRRAPGPAWGTDELRAGFLAIELRPLDRKESLELLRRHGVSGDAAHAAQRWAGGNPLALELGARPARRFGGLSRLPECEHAELGSALVSRLLEERLQGPHLATLAVAATARVTTPRLLAAVLTGANPEAEWDWLASRSFVEPRGEGIAPHELVREAILAGVRRTDPLLERELRRRLADHLYEEAGAAAGPLAIVELGELAGDPALLWGFSWQAASRFRVDGVRAGDLELTDRALRGSRHAPVWEGSRRFFEEAPEHVTVARDAEDRLCALTISLTPATAPRLAIEGPVLGPRIRHARERGRLDAVIWGDAVDLTRDPDSGLFGLLGMAGMLAATSGSPRHGYLPISPQLPGAREFATACGARHLPELDVRIGGRPVECHVIDWGPGGVVAAQREHVYGELGMPPPPRPEPGKAIPVETVRAAFRDLGDPAALGRSPLARGPGVRERSASVRSALTEAVAEAFGDRPGEALTQAVLRRGYLERQASHEAVAEALHLSRAAYFRRLRRGCERVAEYLSAEAADVGTSRRPQPGAGEAQK
jgi:hypothetical protein